MLDIALSDWHKLGTFPKRTVVDNNYYPPFLRGGNWVYEWDVTCPRSHIDREQGINTQWGQQGIW